MRSPRPGPGARRPQHNARYAARHLVWAVALLLGAAVLLGQPVGAQSGGERIRVFRTVAVVNADGSIDVVEEIRYDFGSNQRRGIFRNIPTRFSYDEVKDGYDRLTPLDDFSATLDGTTDQPVERSTEGGYTVFKIGDPDRTLSGAHTYTLRYRLRGALNRFETHDELYLNVTGNEWEVPIERASAEIRTPDDVTDVTCFAGPTGSRLPCTQETSSGSTARFGHGALAAGSGLTVVVAFPVGAVSPPPEPILEQRPTLATAFALRPNTLIPTGLGLAAVAAMGVVVLRRGRDQRFAGGAVAASFGNADGVVETAPTRDSDPIPVEFVPPDGLRPGQVGTLIDETAHTLDVTATIIDLAARGYLRITEIPKSGWLGSPDWQLDSLKPGTGLLTYENTLLSALFASGPSVKLSALKDTFATHLKAVETQLYDDMIAKGWYRKRPDHTRAQAGCLGVVVAVAGLVLTIVLASSSSFGLLGLPVLAFGLFLLFSSGKAPARTAKGHAALRRVKGFKQFIDESEKDRARFAEEQHLFSEYLAYAVVFGAVDKWARAFAGLNGELPRTDWYVSQHAFNAVIFSQAMGSFTTSTSGTISSTPASTGSSGFSGGGSSGGGFGGGGGGSW